jgi:hypothetical protein
MVQRDGVSETVAARRIKEIGADISAFIRHHFQQDAAEPHNFDIVINTGSLNVASATDLVVAAYQARFRQTLETLAPPASQGNRIRRAMSPMPVKQSA